MPYRPLILLSCTLSLACAEEILSLDKISVEESYSVIEERKENSIAKRIIKGEELSQYGDMNALEMLKRTPGVTISDGKGKKGAPGKGYTTVLIDGEEVSSTKRGNPLEQISPDMIERVEVMTNGSAEYTAESMGGIVNIVLKKPASEGKTVAKLTAGAYSGEPMASMFAQREGKSGKLSYLFNTTVADNSQEDTSSTHTNTYDENSDTDGRFRSLSVNTKLIYTPSSSDKYMFDGAFNRSDYTKNSLKNRYGGVNQRVEQNDEGDALMLWTKLSGSHNLSGTELVEWKIKYHQNDSDGITHSDNGITKRQQNDEGLFRVLGAEGSYSLALNEHFIKTGAEVKQLHQRDDVVNYTAGSVSSDNHQRLREDKGAWYVQDEITLGDKTIITPGIRFERSVRQFDQTVNVGYVAPSLHVLYKLSENDNLRASIAKTVKLPRLDELSGSFDNSLDQNDLNHPDITGNPNLKEERALSYEVRYEHFFDDKGIMSIGGFYRNISDKIEKMTTYEFNTNTGTNRYIQRPYNSGEGKLWSLELELKKSLDRYVSGLGIFGNATVQDSSLVSNGVKRTIKGTNDYLYNVGIDHTLKEYRLTYGTAYRYVSGYDDPTDENGVSTSQAGYGTLDLYATKRLSPTYKLGLNLKNITQESIVTTTKGYSDTQIDSENSRFHFLVTLDGRW
ncbi:MAG: TonB-dependent receptor [Sulfuricurvum sp.]|uniref:TonB-dependent receptor plug domain-containing protein n=1 Tax=Sulfuricurvum sp. TaxID=2025608 RepID=UPI00260BF4D3|nr:TonB-dependent receptor [Sulfuricurvum sp.]MDD2828844.1 TonB-dependent receptor [Sulfuricurvum sp.]MDD4948697.1 TonB-dependent receptor [Sulfuricurvum sp.]